MTITFLQPDGVPITAQAARQGSAALYGGGSGRPLGGRSGFRVGTAADTLTATSTVWTLKPCSAMIDPGAATHQGMYGWASDANITGAVTASDATYARKDIVYVQVNDSTSGDGSGAVYAAPVYLAGTPSATPAAPTLPARSFLLGTIDVPKTGAGSPTVTLNPARFAAAGAPLPVASAAVRDALTPYPGLQVARLDIPGVPVETYNGTGWRTPQATAYTPTWSGLQGLGAGYISKGIYWRHGDKVTAKVLLIAGTSPSLGLAAISFSLPAGLLTGPDFLDMGTGVMNSSGTSGLNQPLIVLAGPGQSAATIWATPGTANIQTPGNAGYGWGAGSAFHATITYQTTAA